MARNIKTGEIIEADSAEDLGKIVGCVKSTIHSYCLKEKAYKEIWEISKFKKENFDENVYNSLTEEDLQKWEKGKEAFLKIINRRSKGKLRKPQELR